MICQWAERAVRFRWAVLVIYVALAGLIIWVVGGRFGTEIFPHVETGQLRVRLRAPSGSHVERTEAAALQFWTSLRTKSGRTNVAITLGFVGVHAPSYPINLIYLWNGGSEEGVVQVQLKRASRIESKLQERLGKDLRSN